MRENWGRSPEVHVSNDGLTSLIQPVFPGAEVTEALPLGGGLSNANIKLTVSGRDRPVLLRFFIRDGSAGIKESAIAARLSAVAPVPLYLYIAESNDVTGHPYALVEWIDGERLDIAAKSIDRRGAREIGVAVGRALGRIHSIHFPTTGFLGPDLSVAQPISFGRDGLMAYLIHCIPEGRGKLRIGDNLTRRLLSLIDREGGLLDTWDGPASLTHCDFGSSNIIVDRRDGIWDVSGVVDWEFAMSGWPILDLGNLLRPPMGDLPDFVDYVAEGFRSIGGILPNDWRRMSLLIDLVAWADFLNRPEISEGLVLSARERIEATIAAF